MESKILGRSLVVNWKDSDKARELIELFVNAGTATIEVELQYGDFDGDYVEFVIGNCDEGTFTGIISDLMVEGIELF